MYTALTGPFNLGGVVALSSWVIIENILIVNCMLLIEYVCIPKRIFCLQFPLHKTIQWDTVKKPKILQCHGDSDPLVHYSFGVMTSQLLKPHIPDYVFKSYPMLGHSSNEAELEDLKAFLKKVLP